MSVKHTSKKYEGKTNWNAVKLMTDEEINSAAKLDPEAQPLTKEELKKFKRVNPIKEVDVKLIRENLHLSQDEFANYFGVIVRTIQEWEQHRRTPTATTRNFLKVRIAAEITSYSCAKLDISLTCSDPLKNAGVLVVHRAF